MIVYRYEGKDGLGPYNSIWTHWNLRSRLVRAHGKGDSHPSIKTDYDEAEVCNMGLKRWPLSACHSEKLLRKWFCRYNKELEEAGFKVVAYSVTKPVPGKSGKQIFFYRKDAKRIEI